MFDRLIDFIIQFATIFQFAMVIDSYQEGVLLRFGKFRKVVTSDNGLFKTGLHLFFPFWVDQILTENVVVETRRIKPQSLTTKDGKAVVLSSVITFEIEDVRVFLLEVEGRNAIVEDVSYGAISDFIMKRSWEELTSMENVGNEVAKVVRRQAKRYGVNILNIQLSDFTLCASVRLLQSQSYGE